MSRIDDSVGRVILGRYRVVLQLGRGGQGAVYLARGEGAAGFARPVVVKRILAPLARDPEMLDQFAREARITAQLRHPSIVSVIDFARDGDSHVMVLEYVHGYDLRRWERFVHRVRGHFAPELVVHPVLQVLDALHYAHTLRGADGAMRRVIHRDIGPANVLIDVEGHVKLTDFGIARMADEEITADTTTVRLKGKLPYLAPEMFKGSGPSEQTDLYACGVMLHELLIGKNEFHASSAVESMARVTGHVPTRVDAVRPNMPKALGDVVARALAKEPAERYRSAQEFSCALREVFDQDDNHLAERFRQAIFEDFNDARCAQVTGSAPLSELDAAWRKEPSDLSLADHARSTPADGLALQSEAETVVDTEGELAQSQSVAPVHIKSHAPKSPSLKLYGMGAALAATIGAVVAVFLTTARDEPGPQFVYVDKQTVARSVEAAAPKPEHAPKPQLAATAPVPPETVEEEPANAQVSQADRLTFAFAKRRAAVEQCFARHRVDSKELETLLVQFHIDRQGRVKSAGVVPDELNRTAFGRCVTRVAVTTRFGPQPTPLAFRIPMTTRRQAR